MAYEPIPQDRRRQILKVVFISLLLDLVPLLFIMSLIDIDGGLDIVHIHPPAFPQAPRILPWARTNFILPQHHPESHPPGSEYLQAILLAPDQ